MRNITVNLPGNSYDIIWENNLKLLENLIKEKTKQGIHFVITNHTIYLLYKPVLERLFGNTRVLLIEDGESYKKFITVEKLANEMLQYGANRKSTLWAFGGGVVGDITGFLASIYMRGIPYYQVPTTLLSMVDSSVGGKTGVNLEHGKNMIGTFYQPQGVFIHVNFLKTLGAREFLNGLSEVIKSALLADSDFFQFIESHITEINEHLTKVQINENIDTKIEARNSIVIDEPLIEELSFKSVQVKVNVVTLDEKETGLRAILNLGHTLAHALESLYNYTGIKHGEAVTIGIIYAAYLSLKKGQLGLEDFKRILQVFMKLNMFNKLKGEPPGLTGIGGLPPTPKFLRLIDLMKGDKKNTDESVRFILLKGIGEYTLPEPVDIPTIKKTLNDFIEEYKWI